MTLKYSGTKIMNAFFYVASALSLQPIIDWSLVGQFPQFYFKEYSHFFLIICAHTKHSSSFNIFKPKKKKTVSHFFFHILIKFFLGCIIDIQKNFKKKRRVPASLNPAKQLNAFLRSFSRTLLIFVSYVCKKPKMIFPWGTLVLISLLEKFWKKLSVAQIRC